MPWVCSCGQRNIVTGLACLACERLPQDEMETVETAPARRFRFREEPVEEVVDEVEEVTPPARRFRFTVPEPELTEVQSRDTGSSEVSVSSAASSTTESGFRFSTPAEPVEEELAEEVLALEAPVLEEPAFEEPAFDEPVFEDLELAEQVYEDPVFDAPVVEESFYAAPAVEETADEEPIVEEQVVENAHPGWPEFDRRMDDRRQDDRRSFDVGVEPGELDDRLGAYSAPDELEGFDDPWAPVRDVFAAGLPPLPNEAPTPELVASVEEPVLEVPVVEEQTFEEPVVEEPVVEEFVFDEPVVEGSFYAAEPENVEDVAPQQQPIAQDDDEDPWEAFRRAREEYEAELAAKDVAAGYEAPIAPVEEEFTESSINDLFAPSDIRGFDETLSMDVDDSFTPNVDELAATFQTETPAPFMAEPATYDTPVFAQPVEEFAVPEFEVDPYEVEAIDDHDPILEEVMRHDENALTEEDFAAFPTPWAPEPATEQDVVGAQDEVPYDHNWAQWEQGEQNAQDVPQPQPVQDNTWDNEDSGVWSADAIADAHGDWSTVPQEWTTEDTEWPEVNVAQPVQDDVQPVVEDDAWTQEEDPWTAAGAEPWDPPTAEGEWPVIAPQQPVQSAQAWDEPQEDPWNAVAQPVVDDDPWAQQQVEDDPWVQPQQPAAAAGDAWVDDEADPWNNAQAASDDSAAGEQPWWAEQSGFGGQFAEQEETNLPYFDELDAEDTEDPYAFDDGETYVTQSPVSDLFDDDADLDEPDPYELPDDDWSLPDEVARPSRSARSLDREPQKGRGGRAPAKSSGRSGGAKKKPEPRRKPAKKQRAGGGFRLPFANGSTLITVVVIAIAIIALSLLFKDAFQRVGAATNPDGTTAVAPPSCADSPSNGSKLDVAAVTLGAIDGGTQIADHDANTGTIDFTRALAAESDASMALSILDQSRFERGYDRSFSLKKAGKDAGKVHLSVYEFQGPLCAQEYLKLHPTATAAFTAADVQNSAGEVSQTAPKQFSALLRGPIGDTVVAVEVTGVATADLAKSTAQSVLVKQVVALRDAGVQ